MVFTKEHQEKIVSELLEIKPDATSNEIELFLKGVEAGIMAHIKYLKHE